MYINQNLSVVKKNGTNCFEVTYKGMTNLYKQGTEEYSAISDFYEAMFKLDPVERADAITSGQVACPAFITDMESFSKKAKKESPKLSTRDIVRRGIDGLLRFFSEFSFVPSFRFLNTMVRLQNEGAMRDYVLNYFALTDSAYKEDIEEKMKSSEFRTIITDLLKCPMPKDKVNTRLKVYFGPQGTGKTTVAMEESNGRCIVCNSSMLPADLMEDFTFNDGKAAFNPSILCECMERGETIVLDEINLLPFDSLRFLQGITDNKTQVYYKGRIVNIAEGFNIIGTMNLTLGGATYGLPEPLVDRCSDFKNFTLTADQLLTAIMDEGEGE